MKNHNLPKPSIERLAEAVNKHLIPNLVLPEKKEGKGA